MIYFSFYQSSFFGFYLTTILFSGTGAPRAMLGVAINSLAMIPRPSEGHWEVFTATPAMAGENGSQATHTCPTGDHAQSLRHSGLWWRLFVGLNAKLP